MLKRYVSRTLTRVPRVALAAATLAENRQPFGDAADKKKAIKSEAKELSALLEKLWGIRTHASAADFDSHKFCVDAMIQETSLMIGELALKSSRGRGKQETTLLLGELAHRSSGVCGASRGVDQYNPLACRSDEPPK